MVRRVGFGKPVQPEEEDNPSDTTPSGSTYARLRRDEDTPTRPKAQSFLVRLGMASFLVLWLIAWTIGIIFATVSFLGSDEIDSRIFLAIWISFAVIGWWFAARTAYRILRGKSVKG